VQCWSPQPQCTEAPPSSAAHRQVRSFLGSVSYNTACLRVTRYDTYWRTLPPAARLTARYGASTTSSSCSQPKSRDASSSALRKDGSGTVPAGGTRARGPRLRRAWPVGRRTALLALGGGAEPAAERRTEKHEGPGARSKRPVLGENGAGTAASGAVAMGARARRLLGAQGRAAHSCCAAHRARAAAAEGASPRSRLRPQHPGPAPRRCPLQLPRCRWPRVRHHRHRHRLAWPRRRRAPGLRARLRRPRRRRARPPTRGPRPPRSRRTGRQRSRGPAQSRPRRPWLSQWALRRVSAKGCKACGRPYARHKGLFLALAPRPGLTTGSGERSCSAYRTSASSSARGCNDTAPAVRDTAVRDTAVRDTAVRDTAPAVRKAGGAG
jgi:hypothetical protein